ncbi:MAG: hypothetical protein ABIF85_04995 [Nanoarchaeota archaeon]|nr:hypothetical protein [Nanoarchaeota archaeon]MBU4452335.1 hypothetical protein [Nanoarchaeota archaeon]MCG2724541.1 hypothetical protein [archaeon]
MGININAFGSGLPAILGAGAIILAVMNNANSGTFLAMAIIALIASILLRKI